MSRLALYWLAVLLVFMGLLNSIPGIPGLEQGVRDLTGLDLLKIRKFPSEWFFPLAFAVMMLVVVLKHSIARHWRDAGGWRRSLGVFMDVALVVAGLGLALTYLIEIESICLIDQFTGERARLIEEALKAEIEIAELYGLEPPKSVDDPQCVGNTGGWLVAIMGASILIFLGYNIKVWGIPLVAVALAVALYTIGTVLVWYFHGPDDISKYLMTKLGGEPRAFADGRPKVHDILVNNGSGLLGRFMDIIMNTIFPYLILGSLFGVSAGGQSLIKLAFRWTRKLAGGPAHAAIISSAMFGTISGGPIVNVLSTGVLTIPMMIRRGFSKVFAGGMEAAASSGGSIMPPVMGVAAFVLAALTGVGYSYVIVAAAIPAVAFFFCLFLSVVYQARKQNIQALGELTPDMYLTRQDILNLLMIFGPILMILFFLLTSKEDVGCGMLGWILGAERVFTESGCTTTNLPWLLQLIQNSAGDAGSAGWWAVMFLMGLLFLDPEMRAKPTKLIDALSNAGVLISTLYLMFLAVSIIDFCLQFTSLPVFISLDVLNWLRGFELGAGGSVFFQFLALFLTMCLAILLGMGMPAVPAYVNVALLMGPVLAGLGLSIFTAHMFIFYFAVASAITPPVALAAFAAASITKQDPMATGFAAVKIGIVMFVIPFVFAMYPEILLIEDAIIDPLVTAEKAYLPGYDGSTDIIALIWLLARLFFALLLLASALAKFDRRPLASWEWVARILVAAAIMASSPLIYGTALCFGVVLLVIHRNGSKRQSDLEPV